MANAQYQAGRRFEYARMNHHRAQGREVMRTAGSHGLFDLIVIYPLGDVELIQCKSTSDETLATRMLEVFKNNPPLGFRGRAEYQQVLEVKVKGQRGVRSVVV